MRNNTAYDFEQFAPAAPKIRVVKTGAKKKKIHASVRTVAVLSCAFVALLMVATVYNQLVLSENRAKIESAETELSELEGEYEYLNMQLENVVSLKQAEEYAINELGLVQMDQNQIIYVSLANENAIETDHDNGVIINSLEWMAATVSGWFSN